MLKASKILIPVLAVMVLLGAVGAWDRLAHGKANLNFGSYIPWGLWVGLYIYMVGISGGAFLLVFLHHGLGISCLRRASLYALPVSLFTLGAGLLLVLADLGHMERFWKLYLQPNPGSILAAMVWVYTAFILVLLVMLLALAKGRSRWLKPLSVLGFFLVITFGGGEGALFGVLGARPYWSSGLLPIRFLFSALLAGVAVVAFTLTLFRKWPEDRDHWDAVGFLRYLILGLLAVNVLIEFSEYSITQYAGTPAVIEAHHLVAFGPYWWVFWIVQLFIGFLLPAILLIPSWGLRPFNFALAGFLIGIGYAGTKQNIVLPGLAVPEFRALPEAFVHNRLSVAYFPSVMEWLMAIGAIAAAALLFVLAVEYLPFLRGPAPTGARFAGAKEGRAA
ncbi:MAG TPA: NrfD/PsrC family molybdoenzyme membrane anchor subunit [candidate division Zixibacteria bacterium]|nr:NrfD/PsrC family molybdoenzyme membrane anchor subunit [candidate division Zixibacteria bacterium]